MYMQLCDLRSCQIKLKLVISLYNQHIGLGKQVLDKCIYIKLKPQTGLRQI